MEALLDVLADPNLAFVLLAVGALTVLFEVATPGLGIPGVIGGVMLALGVFGLAGLPVSAPGLVLLVVAAVLFGAEVFAPATGILATLGVLAMLFAGLFLFQGAVTVSLAVLLPTVLVIGAGVIGTGRLAWSVRHQPVTSGPKVMIGREAEVRSIIGGVAQVQIDGVVWRARSPGDLHEGQQVSVVDVDGVTLIVAPRHELTPGDRDAETSSG